MATKNKLRIVIKIGSNLITENENILNYEVIKNLCNQIAAIQKDHNQVIIVSSGAVAAGSQYLSKFEKVDRSLKYQGTTVSLATFHQICNQWTIHQLVKNIYHPSKPLVGDTIT